MRVLCLLLALLAGAIAPVIATAEETLPREQIERIVRDYLMREPEVLYEALQELKRKREVAEAERQRAALAGHNDAIFKDPRDPVLGNPKGTVTLVEFFDYRCGYCRSMTAGLRDLIAKDGGLRVVMKEFPILGPDSLIAAKAALAARRQGRYAELHWALMQATDLSLPSILKLAEGLGLDRQRLAADMESAEVKAAIDTSLALGQALGISGTPSFVIGDALVPGAVPIDRLAAMLAAERRGG